MSNRCIDHNDPTLVEKLANEMADLERGAPSFANIATRLGLSQRTLRRRLEGMGTSYTKILATIRLDAAKRCLATDGLTVDEIAYRLGYTETTNFRHAFRRWTGRPPSAFRAAPPAKPNGRGRPDLDEDRRIDRS